MGMTSSRMSSCGEPEPLDTFADDDLYDLGLRTEVSAWRAMAQARDSRFQLFPGVAVLTYPGEHGVNWCNGLLDPRLGQAPEPAIVVETLESAGISAGVESFRASVHESETGVRAELVNRGCGVNVVNRAMRMTLDAFWPPTPSPAMETATWSEYVAFRVSHEGTQAAVLDGVDPEAFNVVGARRGDEIVSIGLSHYQNGDVGIFDLMTIESQRRRGFGSAVVARLLREAKDRGCETGSVTSSPAAEDLYFDLGFRDFGAVLECVRRTGKD